MPTEITLGGASTGLLGHCQSTCRFSCCRIVRWADPTVKAHARGPDFSYSAPSYSFIHVRTLYRAKRPDPLGTGI
jgi:hypothetical protein